jgi:hypothetical protein
MHKLVILRQVNTECYKKSFTTLKAYIHLFRGHAQCTDRCKTADKFSSTRRLVAGTPNGLYHLFGLIWHRIEFLSIPAREGCTLSDLTPGANN